MHSRLLRYIMTFHVKGCEQSRPLDLLCQTGERNLESPHSPQDHPCVRSDLHVWIMSRETGIVFLREVMRPFRLFSYNVRGLASQTRRVCSRLILKGLQNIPNVICLQEYKLRGGGEMIGFKGKFGEESIGSMHPHPRVYTLDVMV